MTLSVVDVAEELTLERLCIIVENFLDSSAIFEESVDTILPTPSEVRTSVVCRLSSIRQPQSPPPPQARVEQLVEPSVYEQSFSSGDNDQSSLNYSTLEQSYCEEPSLLSHSLCDEHVQVEKCCFCIIILVINRLH